MAVAYKHLSDRVPSPSDVLPDLPEELDGFVAAATDRDRELRPESADVMRMDLDVIASQLPPAQPLASLVTDIPTTVTVEGGETTEIGVRLATSSIPRMERHRRRRRLLLRFVGAILLLGLLAGAAWGTWTYAIPHTAVVPQLRGRPLEQARDRLTTMGFEVETAAGRYDLEIPSGQVLLVRPRAGVERELGTVITLVPSRGPPPVEVPNVVGKAVQPARDAIVRAGLHVKQVKRRYDDEVPIDHVVAVRPDRAMLPTGTAVTLVVSDGPRPVPIPDVTGMRASKAVDRLSAAGFEVVTAESFSNEVDRGRVVGTDPAIGTQVQPGETIVVTVSLGPEFFPTPDFIGMSVDAAKAAAERIGLELTALPVPGSSGGNIVSQLPPPGTRVRYGSTITAYYA
jgi:serine/threonine-protein kinase